MNVDKAKRRRFPRFSLRGLLIAVAFLAVCLGWLVDRSRLKREAERLSGQAIHGKMQLFYELITMDASGELIAVGKPVEEYPYLQGLADGTFDEKYPPELWERALKRYQGEQYYHGPPCVCVAKIVDGLGAFLDQTRR